MFYINLLKFVPEKKRGLAAFLSIVIIISALVMFYVYVYRATEPPINLPLPVGGDE